jgi:hypothetical protein
MGDSRFIIWSQPEHNGGYYPSEATTFEQAQDQYMSALRVGSVDVIVCERVPMLLLDGRSAQAKLLAYADRIERIMTGMREHHLSVKDLARCSRLGEKTIEDALSLRTFSAQTIESIEDAYQRACEVT